MYKWDWTDYAFAILLTLMGIGCIVGITIKATEPPTPQTIVGVLGEAHCCQVEYHGYGNYSLRCENGTTIKGAANFIDTGKLCE